MRETYAGQVDQWQQFAGGYACGLADRFTHVGVSFSLTDMGCFSIVSACKRRFLLTCFYPRWNQRQLFGGI